MLKSLPGWIPLASLIAVIGEILLVAAVLGLISVLLWQSGQPAPTPLFTLD